MKKTISILLVLTVLVNVLSFGFLDVKASAIAGVDDAAIISIVGTALAGAATGTSSYIINNGISTSSQDLGFDLHGFNNYHKTNRFATATETGATDGFIMYDKSTGVPRFSADPSAPADQAGFASYLADYLNSSSIATGGAITVKQYEDIKTAAVNGYLNYIDEKKVLSDTNLFAHGGTAFGFSFVDPVTGVPMPMSTDFVMTNIQGFTLLPAHVVTDNISGYFDSEQQAISYGAERTGTTRTSDGKTVYYGFRSLPTNYGNGIYVIYNGDIYYRTNSKHLNQPFQGEIGVQIGGMAISSYVSANGVSLSDAGCTSLAGLNYGIYYCTDPNTTLNAPTNVLPDDLTATTGGGTIEIPNSRDESIIGAAIAAGILTPDSPLTIENGEITGADGIDLTKIETLLKTLAGKNVDLSTVESYLAAIKAACEATGTNTSDIERILTNIETSISNNTTNISTINTAIAGVKELETSQLAELEAIKDNTKTAAEVLTEIQGIKGDYKVDIPAIPIIDKFPFSLPWDLYNIISIICMEPKEPIFVVPIKTTIKNGGLNYDIDEEITLDLTMFRLNGVDIVRSITNSATILLVVICLISMTRKLIWK